MVIYSLRVGPTQGWTYYTLLGTTLGSESSRVVLGVDFEEEISRPL
jgi:hypothetical protein